MKVTALIACGVIALAAAGCGSSSKNSSTTTKASNAAASAQTKCPGGTVRFGVEPYDSGPKFTAAYQALTTALSQNLGCPVKLIVAESYTAEVEAMRAKKLDLGEFGPLGYIFAHKLANAEPIVAFGDANSKPVTYTAGIWVPKDSSVQSVGQLKGKKVALADPGSTSGSLYPKFAIAQAGLKNGDVHLQYAGSHPASLLALTHKKVDAGEVNSQQQATATDAGQFKASDYREIWKSTPIENDPITVRGDLPPEFKQAVTQAFLKLTPDQLKTVDTELGVDSGPMVPATDDLYQGIRDVVETEHLNISAIG
jgi:phosphonate transport system substrate-binding protein